MKWLIMGTGGVGGYFGGRLAEAGRDVVFVARGEHLQALRRDGLRVSSVAGDFAVHPVHAVEDPAAAGPTDAVLFAVKSWQTGPAARALVPAIGPTTCVLSLQNGATAAEEIGAVVGRERMLGGVCRLVAFRSAPGEITHAGIDPEVVVGELDGSRTERLEAVLADLRDCRGVRAVPADDIERAIWAKFLFIAAVSGVGAVTRVPAGRFRAVPETRRLLEAALREVETVARARGVALAGDVVDSTLAFIDGLPAEATASMQRDLTAGRPSELDALSGAVVRLGRAAGVATPVHGLLYAALRPQEMVARSPGPPPAG